MKNPTILTIGIPTYNRPDSLEETLKQLQNEKHDHFNILIIDDYPLNNYTQKLIGRYQQSMPNISYYRNNINLGYAKNILRIYELTKTPYVWLLSDDDKVLPGAPKKIINAVSIYKPTVAVFNHVFIDSYGKNRVAGVEETALHTDIKNFDSEKLQWTGFLSGIIVEKRISLTKIKKTYFKKNVFFQVTLCLFLLSKKFRYCQVAESIVKRNTCYESGEFFKIYLVDYLKAITLLPTIFNIKKMIISSRHHLIKALQLYLSQKIGMYKYHGTPTMDTLFNIFKFYSYYGIFIIFFPVIYFIIPRSVLKYMYLNKLQKIYSKKKAHKIFDQNINRANRNRRVTGFVTYR